MFVSSNGYAAQFRFLILPPLFLFEFALGCFLVMKIFSCSFPLFCCVMIRFLGAFFIVECEGLKKLEW